MRKKTSIFLAALFAGTLAATAASPVALVICAPGYPSNTAEAQPSMDALASAVAQQASWPPGRLEATYYASEEGGVDRLKAGGPTLALVPLPFYLRHAEELKLTAKALAVPMGGAALERWTLVAGKGRVTSPASLTGYTIVSLAGYAPEFIRKVALEGWGPIPKDVSFEASGQVLTTLRRAASGDKVAVLLDGVQGASLATLPFARELETVATSVPLPAALLCSVGSAMAPSDGKTLESALLKMGDTSEGAAALDAVRLVRFVPLDAKAVAAARAAYDGGRAATSR